MTNLYTSFKFLFKNFIQTTITTVVVIVGTAIFYFILNSSSSLKQLVLSSTADANSHIFLNGSFDFNSYEDQTVIDFRSDLHKADRSITDVSFVQYINGYVILDDGKYHNLMLKGIDFIHGGAVQSIVSRIEDEKDNKIPENGDFEGIYGQIVIGDKLAKELGYVNPLNARNNYLTYYYNGQPHILKIVAVHISDYIELSLNTIYTTIQTTQTISNNNTTINAIEIKVKKPLKSQQSLEKIKPVINDYYQDATIVEWQEGNKYAVNALYIEDVSIFIIQLFTALAVSFGINGLLLFNIRQKINQIGILKAMGITKKDTLLIFLYQTIFIVIIGVILGLLLGHFFSVGFMKVFRRPTSDAPLVALQSSLLNIHTLITFSVISVSTISFSFIPIQYAQRLKIIEVIKND